MNNETKKELINRLQSSRFYVSAHGGYNKKPNIFIVPKNTIYIFMSKPGRYICDDQIIGSKNLKNYFRNKTNIIPRILKNFKSRTYGSGEIIHNMKLQLHNKLYNRYGIYKLPMKNFFLPGNRPNITKLSQLHGGIFYIGACRSLPKQPIISNQNIHITYPTHISTIAKNLILRNFASASHLKRKRVNQKYSQVNK